MSEVQFAFAKNVARYDEKMHWSSAAKMKVFVRKRCLWIVRIARLKARSLLPQDILFADDQLYCLNNRILVRFGQPIVHSVECPSCVRIVTQDHRKVNHDASRAAKRPARLYVLHCNSDIEIHGMSPLIEHRPVFHTELCVNCAVGMLPS